MLVMNWDPQAKLKRLKGRDMRRTLVLKMVLLWAIAACWSSSAEAGDNDVQLNRLATCAEGTVLGPGPTPPPGQAGTGCIAQPDRDGFIALATSLGQVFAPSMLAPAETLGEAGFAVGVEAKISLADNGNQWRALNGSTDETTSPPLFSLLQFHIRKGLPFSFELDGSLSWLMNSEMMWVGGGLKWTLLESMHLFVPDIAVRGFGGSVVGSPDLTLTTAGVDVAISKEIGAGGLMSFTPYAGFNMLFVFASSRVLDADPGFSATPTGSYQPEFVFDNEELTVPRGFGGVRFNISHATLTAEVASSGKVHNIGFNLGANC
jgi:hypothetical protein